VNLYFCILSDIFFFIGLIPAFIVVSYLRVGRHASMKDFFLSEENLQGRLVSNGSRVSLPKGRNILEIFSDLPVAAPFCATHFM